MTYTYKTNKETLTLNLFWLSYVILPLFLSNSICSAVKSLLIFLLLFLLLFHKKNKSSFVFGIILPFFIFFLTIQAFFFHNKELIKLLINITTFFILCRYASFKLLKNTSVFLRYCTLIAIIPVLLECARHGALYFFRDSVPIEKQTFSILFAISSFYCLISIFQNEQKKLNLFMLSLFTIINVFIIQSKTSLLILVLDILLLFLLNEEARKKIKRFIPLFLLMYLFLLFFFPSIALPDDIRYGINRLAGNEILSSKYTRIMEHLSMTYDVRADMKDYCFRLFKEHPILGVGIGNFAVLNRYSSNYFNDLIEPESSWLSILTEGGLCYMITMIIFFGVGIKKFYNMWIINNKDLHYLAGIILFFNFALLFIFNDFMDSIFWINSGLMMGGLINMETKKTIDNDTLT